MSLRLALLFLLTSMLGCMRSEHSEEAKRGQDHIQYYGRGSCHTIPGVPGAHATVGPPLDQMANEVTSRESCPIRRPIQHPEQIHPGTAMPELGVTPQDAKEIAAYLEELR
jgi:cytochrome c2